MIESNNSCVTAIIIVIIITTMIILIFLDTTTQTKTRERELKDILYALLICVSMYLLTTLIRPCASMTILFFAPHTPIYLTCP